MIAPTRWVNRWVLLALGLICYVTDASPMFLWIPICMLWGEVFD